jgi:hypothetical protein
MAPAPSIPIILPIIRYTVTPEATSKVIKLKTQESVGDLMASKSNLQFCNFLVGRTTAFNNDIQSGTTRRNARAY